MASDLNKVSGYVSDTVYEKLTDFKSSHRLKSVSQAVVLILQNYFGISSNPLTDIEITPVLTTRVERLESQLATQVQQLSQMTEALGQLRSTLTHLQAKLETVDTNSDENRCRRPIERTPTITSLQPHKASLLARRLGVSKSTISLYKQRTDFPEWSRERDPQGVAWKYNSPEKLFRINTPAQVLDNKSKTLQLG